MRAPLRTLAILACTIGLLALFLRQANPAEVWHQIRDADLLDLTLALIATAALYVFRSWRWRTMLLPLGAVRFRNAARATVIGFALSALLPARPGEVLRPYLLARREGLSATSTFATILLERLLDLMTMLLLFGVFVLMADPAASSADPALYQTVRAGGLVAGVTSLVGLGFVFVMAGHPERLGALTRKAERFLPLRLAHALGHAVERFAGGFAVMRRPGPLVQALALSLPVWLSIAAGIWFVARAFHITIPFSGTFLIMALLTIGVAVPTPGAVGGFHYAFRVGMTTFFGAPNEPAVGAAIVLHAISFLPVTLLGLAFMVQDGLSLGGLRHLADRAAGEGSPPEGGAREAFAGSNHRGAGA